MANSKYPVALVARIKGAIAANISHKRIARATGLSTVTVRNLSYTRKDVEADLELLRFIDAWLNNAN
jgi:Tfp pilus assembly PilM family ATPase